MSIDAKWWTREKWTLIEAAQICAGVNPYLGRTPTDSPHDVLARIEDPAKRELFEELYSRSKNVLRETLAVAEEPRTRYLGNTRVRPFDYVIWVFDLPLAPHLDALVPRNELGKVFGGKPLDPTLDPHEGEELGPTFEEAAKTLAHVGGVVEGAILERMWQAVLAGDLELVNPQTKLPRKGPPRVRRDWFDRVRVAKLNEWLATLDAAYRHPDGSAPDEPSTSRQDDTNAEIAKSVDRDTIIEAFKVFRDETRNKKFWNDVLARRPKWIADACVIVGSRGVSSRWSPTKVALAIERHHVGDLPIDRRRLDGFMKSFPKCAEEWRGLTQYDD